MIDIELMAGLPTQGDVKLKRRLLPSISICLSLGLIFTTDINLARTTQAVPTITVIAEEIPIDIVKDDIKTFIDSKFWASQAYRHRPTRAMRTFMQRWYRPGVK